MKRLLLLGLLLLACSKANAYIEWTAFQYSVNSGTEYEMAVSAGWSVDSYVYVYKNGAYFAYAEDYGNAYAGGTTTDYGNQTVHYTAEGSYDRTSDWGYWDYDSSSFDVTIIQPNNPPIINWTMHPDTAAVNESFSVQGRGNDDDGNLANVFVWREWVPQATNYAGNGYESFATVNGMSMDHSGSVIFQTQAQDSQGALSAVIFHTVYVSNNAPSVSASAASIYVGQTATVSWSASDPNNNLSYVNAWVTRWGSPYWDDLGSGGATGSKSWSASANFNSANAATGSYLFVVRAVDNEGAYTDSYATFDIINRAPDIATVSSGGATQINLGQSVTISGTLHDPDGNLAYHNLYYAAPGGTFVGLLSGTPSNGTNSSLSTSVTPPSLGLWQFHSNGHDGYTWGPGATLSINVVDGTAPSVPGGLNSSVIGGTSFTLNWSASSDNVGVTAYEVMRSGISLGTTASTSMPVTGLAQGATYSMSVRAQDAAGNWSGWSTALPVTTQDPEVPTIPTGLVASNITGTSFTLSWTASTDNVGVTGYEVRRDATLVGSPAGTSLSITGLTQGTSYSMTVRAKDAVPNWTNWSTALNVTTASAPAITAHPQGQTLYVGSNASFSVSATGTAVLSYQWRKNGSNISGATGSTYAITNVQASHAGNYDVVVTNSVGSATSNAASLVINLGPQPDTNNQNQLNVHRPTP